MSPAGTSTPRPRALGRTSLSARPGFTLLELLVVIAILGMLLALGTGGYMALARGADIEGTASRLRSVLVHARNSTIFEGAPAAVFIEDIARAELRDPVEFIEGELLARRDDLHVFDVKGMTRGLEVPDGRVVRIEHVKRVRSMGFRTVGAWHLEQSAQGLGYLGRDCDVQGGEAYWGKIGTAVLLNPPGEQKGEMITARAAADDAADPFRLRGGGRIELWAYALRPATSDGILAQRKGSYELKVSRDGVVTGGVAGEVLEAEGYIMSFNRWVKFALEFGPDYIALYIDDVLRAGANRDGGRYDPPEEGELVFGKGFSGVLDEIRVQSRVEGEAFDLVPPYELEGPAELYLDGRGRLDPTFHTAPVTYELLRDDTAVSITVETSGRVD